MAECSEPAAGIPPGVCNPQRGVLFTLNLIVPAAAVKFTFSIFRQV